MAPVNAANRVCDASVASGPRLSLVCGSAPPQPPTFPPVSRRGQRLRGAPHPRPGHVPSAVSTLIAKPEAGIPSRPVQFAWASNAECRAAYLAARRLLRSPVADTGLSVRRKPCSASSGSRCRNGLPRVTARPGSWETSQSLRLIGARVRTEVAREFVRNEHGRDPMGAREIAATIAKQSRPRTQTVAGYA